MKIRELLTIVINAIIYYYVTTINGTIASTTTTNFIHNIHKNLTHNIYKYDS